MSYCSSSCTQKQIDLSTNNTKSQGSEKKKCQIDDFMNTLLQCERSRNYYYDQF